MNEATALGGAERAAVQASAGSRACECAECANAISPAPQAFLDSFQPGSGPVWNRFKSRFFLLHRAMLFNIDCCASAQAFLFFMIVCSCNVLTDHDVRSAVSAADDLPRNAKQLYGCLGCSAECGRCARTIKAIIDEALGACAASCCSGCPHSRVVSQEPAHRDFAIAAG